MPVELEHRGLVHPLEHVPEARDHGLVGGDPRRPWPAGCRRRGGRTGPARRHRASSLPRVGGSRTCRGVRDVVTPPPYSARMPVPVSPSKTAQLPLAQPLVVASTGRAGSSECEGNPGRLSCAPAVGRADDAAVGRAVACSLLSVLSQGVPLLFARCPTRGRPRHGPRGRAAPPRPPRAPTVRQVAHAFPVTEQDQVGRSRVAAVFEHVFLASSERPSPPRPVDVTSCYPLASGPNDHAPSVTITSSDDPIRPACRFPRPPSG